MQKAKKVVVLVPVAVEKNGVFHQWLTPPCNRLVKWKPMFLVELLGGHGLCSAWLCACGDPPFCHGSIGRFLVHLYFGQFLKEAREPLHWEVSFLFRMFFFSSSYYEV